MQRYRQISMGRFTYAACSPRKRLVVEKHRDLANFAPSQRLATLARPSTQPPSRQKLGARVFE